MRLPRTACQSLAGALAMSAAFGTALADPVAPPFGIDLTAQDHTVRNWVHERLPGAERLVVRGDRLRHATNRLSRISAYVSGEVRSGAGACSSGC